MDEDWKVVYTSNELHLAELARLMLQDNGIASVIMNKQDSTYPLIGHIELMVEEFDRKRAEQLLTGFET
jgi:hypothetical protein